jgi:hypothetical protein
MSPTPDDNHLLHICNRHDKQTKEHAEQLSRANTGKGSSLAGSVGVALSSRTCGNTQFDNALGTGTSMATAFAGSSRGQTANGE